MFIYNLDEIQISGHCIYHQFNIQQFHVLPTQSIYGFCVDLRKKQRLFPYTTLTGFYKRDGVCLLRGTEWKFKQISYFLSLYELMLNKNLRRLKLCCFCSSENWMFRLEILIV